MTDINIHDDAEKFTRLQSRKLKIELSLKDLVLAQILFVIGPAWLGTAGKLGSSYLWFWLLAAFLFYVPVALVLTYLIKLLPFEGGLYQWARLGFDNELVGFMVGWNVWLFAIVNMSSTGLEAATYCAYAIGPRATWLADSKIFAVAVNAIVLFGLAIIAVLGLAVGKWVHNIGSIIAILSFIILFVAAIANIGRLREGFHWFSTSPPAWSLHNLNLLSKISFGAFGGLEYAAIVAGECHDASHSLNRSVLIAGPILAALYVLGTFSILAFVAPADIDLVGPIPQALRIGFQGYRILSYIVPAVILAQLTLNITSASVNFTGNTRLPMVAGWAHVLPAWFSRLHHKYRTPINSILCMALVTLGAGATAQLGAKPQEAFQLLLNTTGVFYALAYVAMFGIPLFGLKQAKSAPPVYVKIAAVVGLGMIVTYVLFSVFPIVTVESRRVFAFKISGMTIGANVIGLGLFLLNKRRVMK